MQVKIKFKKNALNVDSLKHPTVFASCSILMLASNYSLQCFISPIIVSPDFFLLALSLIMITTPTFKELNEFSLLLS